MNAKKAPPTGRKKEQGKARKWVRRGALAALLIAACALVWGRVAAPPKPDAVQTTPTATAGAETPAPTATPDPQARRTAREAAYDKDVAALTALLESGAADEETRAHAAQQLERLVADHQSELGLEEALNKAGFEPCVVLLQNGALTVVVSAQHMTGTQSAAILSLCAAHTDIGVENIRIMAREGM